MVNEAWILNLWIDLGLCHVIDFPYMARGVCMFCTQITRRIEIRNSRCSRPRPGCPRYRPSARYFGNIHRTFSVHLTTDRRRKWRKAATVNSGLYPFVYRLLRDAKCRNLLPRIRYLLSTNSAGWRFDSSWARFNRNKALRFPVSLLCLTITRTLMYPCRPATSHRTPPCHH